MKQSTPKFEIKLVNTTKVAVLRYDGDIILVSNNQYLIQAIGENKPLITYAKKKTPEKRLSYIACATMDTNSFDTKIGFITNLASNFIAMLNNYKENSEEYKELKKRIDLLRFYQGSKVWPLYMETYIE